MPSTAADKKIIASMPEGTRVEHNVAGFGTVSGPARFLQIPVRFDEDSSVDRYCYPINLQHDVPSWLQDKIATFTPAEHAKSCRARRYEDNWQECNCGTLRALLDVARVMAG